MYFAGMATAPESTSLNTSLRIHVDAEWHCSWQISPSTKNTMYTKDRTGIIHHVNSTMTRSVSNEVETDSVLISENCLWTADHDVHGLRPNETSADIKYTNRTASSNVWIVEHESWQIKALGVNGVSLVDRCRERYWRWWYMLNVANPFEYYSEKTVFQSSETQKYYQKIQEQRHK